MAPVASVPIENLYKTDKDYLDAIIGTYSALRVSYSNMWQFGDIRGEKRFEFAFEGHRWFDLVRTGKALSALAPVGMKEYMTVFPVPLSQMQVMNNTAIFSQNSGYN